MQQQRFTASTTRRLLTTLAAAAYWPILFPQLWFPRARSMPAWEIALTVAVGLAGIAQAVRAWRGFLLVDDRGLTIDNGFGRSRHIRWPQITEVRRHPNTPLPPTIAVEDSRNIRMGLSTPSISGLEQFVDRITTQL